MTEQDWLHCADLLPMLWFLEGKATDRKLRLFGCACCRRIWHELLNCVATHTKPEQNYRAVETAERYADGKATPEELTSCLVDPPCGYAAPAAFFGTAGSPLDLIDVVNSAADAVAADDQKLYRIEEQAQVTLLRDIIHNPFRAISADPIWLTPTVLALAQAAYEHRKLPGGTLDPNRLAVLADALEEVGCTDASLLGHLRSAGPHVRGCFVLDLLLEKA